jgi:hypothetical protein
MGGSNSIWLPRIKMISNIVSTIVVLMFMSIPVYYLIYQFSCINNSRLWQQKHPYDRSQNSGRTFGREMVTFQSTSEAGQSGQQTPT